MAKSAMEQFASARTHPADLINGAIETLVREHFELPALSTLRRIAGTVQQRIHDQLFEQVAKSLTQRTVPYSTRYWRCQAMTRSLPSRSFAGHRVARLPKT